jgi:hypothetical protein
MRRTVVAAVVSAIAAAIVSATPVPSRADDPDALTVHEWGTFTSIAGSDGTPVDWHPLGGPSDLPCFVERSAFNRKGALAGTVRMETPVLYFYAPRDTIVDVRVRFHGGVITEWFPHASVAQSDAPTAPGSTSAIAWTRVRVSPGGAHDFPVEQAASHYYTARETNAAAVRSGSQTEKFLFYRGVGRFTLPIAATIDDAGRVIVRKQGPGRIDAIILFSNDRGRLRYEVRRAADGLVTVDPPVTDLEPSLELQRMLVANGLYPEEANAMVETWRDSWFEEGTRLFYVVPRRVIDSVLPLDINPPAADVARVFVTRTELVTAAAEHEITRALLANDFAALATYGRFLEAIGHRILANASAADRMLLERRLERVYSAMMTFRDRCAG